MQRLESVLATLTRMQGDAVLLHAGERIVVLSETGQTPIPGMVLTAADVESVLTAVLPSELRPKLVEQGSIEHRRARAFPDGSDLGVTAIQSGPDVWLELRCTKRGEAPADRGTSSTPTAVDFERWIRQAHASGADAVVVAADAPPIAKRNGAVQALAEQPIDAGALRRGVLALTETITKSGALESSGGLEWTVAGVGLVGCRITTDRRGPGVFFDLQANARPSCGLEVPGLLRELVLDSEGLLLVAGRTSRDRTRMAHALVETIATRRSVHAICLEHARSGIHDHGLGIVSQRVVAEDSGWDAMLDQIALERPDVLLLDGLPVESATAVERAIEWAANGSSVIMTIDAATAVAGLRALLERLGGSAGAAERCAAALTAAIAVATLPARAAGRATACEALPITSSIRKLIVERAYDRIALALERREGDAHPFTAALAELVGRGQVGLRAALQVAGDPDGLLSLVRAAEMAGVASTTNEVVELSDLLSEDLASSSREARAPKTVALGVA